jgi:hypothetical protein
MLLSAIFLVSLSTLAFEILLTRVFSIGQWNHLSFMVISIALFGFAASGNFLSILDSRNKNGSARLSTRISISVIGVLFTGSALFSFYTLTKIPLDYFRLPLEPVQSFYLMTAYILLALPFFFCGLLIALGYATAPQKSGLIYFATMCGSACGAVLPAVLLPYFGEEKLIITAVLMPSVGVLISTIGRQRSYQARSAADFRPKVQTALAVCCAALIISAALLISPRGSATIRVKPSAYKGLSQILQFPDTTIIETTTSIRGRNQRVQTPYIRFAPGISLKYTKALPHQHAIFRDGANQFVLYDFSASGDAQFAASTLSFSGYDLVPDPQDVLIIENDGGLAIACAVASGAANVRVAAENPGLARSIRRHYHLPVLDQNPRAYLARNDEKFQIIHVEDWGSSLTGSDALNQHHLLTTEAFSQYINHLTPDGVVIVSRRLLLPPAGSIRLWASAYDSLKREGVQNPGAHLAMLRNWDTFTLIVSAAPLNNPQKLTKFARDLSFDIVYLPRVNHDDVNRFNIYDEPYHFFEIDRLAKAYLPGRQKIHLNEYLLDVLPQSDNRPFPGKFLKWRNLRMLHKTLGSRMYALFLSAEIIVSVVFLEALLVSIILLFVPQLVFLKGRRRPAGSQIIYFTAVGAGFMFVELFFIKRFILLFGDAVISVAVVLGGVLVFSGLGGLWAHLKRYSGIRYFLILLIAALIITAVSCNFIIGHILAFSKPWRYLGAIMLLIPAGVAMGLPFPMGMRLLLADSAQRSYAWSVNGCASVLASIASAQIALSFGISHIMAFAILAYLIALLCLPKQPPISVYNP